MKHTFTRSDRDTHVSVDMTECGKALKTHFCQTKVTMGGAGDFAEAYCKNDANKGTITASYVPGYDKTVPAKLAKCMTAVCVEAWLRQYKKSPLRILGNYDKNSIMHYPFENGTPLEPVSKLNTKSKTLRKYLP